MLQSEHTYCAAFHGVVRLSEFCIGSRGIIKDVCKVWGKSGCCRVNMCAVNYVSLSMAVLYGVG